jgi:hemolysin activation/secretion protein
MPMNLRIPAMRQFFQLACTAALIGGSLSVPAKAFAQPVQPAGSATPGGVVQSDGPVIRGFSVTGKNPLPDNDVTLILAPFLRKPATLENLQAATASLEAALRDRGFGLHRVVLPPQEVDETITLHLVHFTMGSVTVEGSSAFSEANIRASLPELQEGGTPHLERLALQTALANENASKNVQVALRASDKPDQIDAAIKVQDALPLKFSANLNNTGSRQSGRDRFTLAASHDNLFDSDHQLLAAYTTSLAKPSAVSQLGLSYRVPLYARLSTLELSYTQSDVVGDFGTFSSSGAGRTMGVVMTRHLLAPQGQKRQVQVGLEDKTFDATLMNGVALSGQTLRRTRPLSLGYASGAQSDRAKWDAAVSVLLNLPGGAGNDLASYRSESPSVTRARWTALRARASWASGFGDGWAVAWRGQAQWTPDALIAGEQLGLGGYSTLRGTQERALAGDTGLTSSLEVSTPEWLPGLRWVGFWDAGWVASHLAASVASPGHDSAASVGLGVRYSRGPVSMMLDYGRVISGSRTPLTLNSSAPKTGDHKLHFSFTARY